MALNTVEAVSIKRTHEILSGVFYIPISTEIINNMVKRRVDCLTGTVDKRFTFLDISSKRGFAGMEQFRHVTEERQQSSATFYTDS